MKTYKEITVKTLPFNSEILTSVLWELELSGIRENDDSLTLYCEEENNIQLDDVKILLENLKAENLINHFEVSEISFEDKNWNEEWESKIDVVEVSDKIVIKPTFRKYDSKPGQIILTIDPKMSFGTGEHQSTRLMLLLMEKYIKGNEKVLDVGSGTGVLAIGAVKLGSSNAIAIDNNEWCKLNGEENIVLNNVEDRVKILLGEISDIEEDDYDLVLANINKNVLIDIVGDLYKKTAGEGLLIISGILIIDLPQILEVYQSTGFIHLDDIQQDDWTAVLFKKRSR
ncbi:MAG: 50S ribosomal protein L11 methyltransferase [Melioribacteraceae bacterium]|nr:50S ribosomal protein L11 methyltransferase [Melioribacteraceae bacterium]